MTAQQLAALLNRALGRTESSHAHGRLKHVGETIRSALATAGLLAPAAHQAPAAAAGGLSPEWSGADETTTARKSGSALQPGAFTVSTFANAGSSRDYRLYVPSTYTGAPMPLIVMLHGCKQDSADFARGTGMNELAERRGFLVLYPEQARRANGANCWNWFQASQQLRNGEEPELLAGMVNHISTLCAVDRARVFAAGLSAGASMAVILGATYPEVFRAIAAHSGLPIGVAHDVASAFVAMRGKRPAWTPADPAQTGAGVQGLGKVPTIVFHGDADNTVAASNAEGISENAARQFACEPDDALSRLSPRDIDVNGRRASVTCYTDASGHTQVEQWIVHGAAHAWFGGDPNGSYTDPTGPDASAEIVRFFLEQPRPS